MARVLFYVKCRPQGVDAWSIAERYRRVFVGYPVRRRGATAMDLDWRQPGLRQIFADVADSEFDAVAEPVSGSYKGQVTRNRRLAAAVEAGSVVLVPRVQHGVCYAGELTGPFELIDQPKALADDYLELRREMGQEAAPELRFLGDVIQTWPVKGWKTLSFPAIPRWISHRLLSRNTVGVIHDGEGISALDTVRRLMALDPKAQFGVLRDDSNLEQSLLNWLTPTTFEHLVVDVLRVSEPLDWFHVGGSGDGGVDGLGIDDEGVLRAVLQCKLHFGGDVAMLAERVRRASGYDEDVKVVIAVLHGHHEAKPGADFLLLNRAEVADRLRQFASLIPLARSFGLVS